MHFISTPYLPQGKTELAVSGFSVSGLTVIPPPRLKSLPPSLQCHADLGLCPIGGREVVCPPDSYPYYYDKLTPYGFSVICGDKPLGRSYPEDTAYNVVVVGKYALLNPAVCAEKLLKLLENRFEIVPVKQGYAKCSAAPVTENAFITADLGIARAAERAGLEALLISNAGVELPPYSSGFFGGACGLVSAKELAVNGSLSFMEDGCKIKKFLKDKGISAMETNSNPPFDTGSLIPLTICADNMP